MRINASFAPDKPVELVFEHLPTAAYFGGLDFTGSYIFEIRRTGNLEIKAGLLRVKDNAVVTEVQAG